MQQTKASTKLKAAVAAIYNFYTVSLTPVELLDIYHTG